MARKQVDMIDLAFGVPFVLGSLLSLGLMDLTLLGHDLAATVWSVGDHTAISMANLLGIAALVGVLVTNDLGVDLTTTVQGWVVLATVALVIAPPFVPLIEAAVGTNEWTALVGFTIQTMGFGIVLYEG